MDVDSGYAEVNGVRLHYEKSGKGDPILLIHGFPRWLNDFHPIIPELSKTNKVYSLDLRGHGKSGRADSYTFSDYKQDIIQFIEQEINQPVIILGNSLGGWIALMIAETHPHLLKAVILGDPPLDLVEYYPEFPEFADRWREVREHASKPIDELRKEYDDATAERLSLIDPNVFKLWIECKEDKAAYHTLLAGYRIEKSLESLSSHGVPVLLVQGNTKTMSDRDVEQATVAYPDISHVYLKNQGHYMGLLTGETGDLLNALSGFLSSL